MTTDKARRKTDTTHSKNKPAISTTSSDLDALREQERIDELIRKKVPPIYRKASYEEFKALELIDPLYPWYLYSAITGTGKTHYAYSMVIESIIHHVREEKPMITVINFPEYMRRYKHVYFDQKEVIAQELKKGLIIFDDLGAEYITDDTLELLIGVLDSRIKHFRWTSFTSNRSLSELPYDRRIKSRIAEIIGENFGELKGKDRRIAKPNTERTAYGTRHTDQGKTTH